MTLKTQMTSDLSVFFNTDEHAETITYTPKDGLATEISAIVIRDSPFQEAYVRGEGMAICEITVKKSDVPALQYGDTFTFGDADALGVESDWEFDPTNGVIREDDNTVTTMLEREL